MRSHMDLHVHTSASDGTDTPEELPKKAAREGIHILAITDHDTVDGVRRAAGAVPEGMRLIPGVEFSCRASAGKCHILGLGVDISGRELWRALEAGAKLRREKLETRLMFLKKRGIVFPEEETLALRAMPAAGKPHLANLMVRYGYAESREQAMAGVLDLCPTGNDRIEAEEAISAILDSGGVPVWAHPRGGIGESVGDEEFFAMLPELMGYGLRGLECLYPAYTEGRRLELKEIAGRAGLLVSGGSDYHGLNKKTALGELCGDGRRVTENELTVLEALG